MTPPRNRPANQLFYGDNLVVLRREIADESVDLIYLDPPFNSNATYNILFRSPTGGHADAQIAAFEDSWHWNAVAEEAFDDVRRSGHARTFDLLHAMRGFLGDNDMMAYLAMMAVRLIELHRVLKPTGSLYLHCDPTASHYLKLLLDGVFGVRNFGNEIIWKRQNAKGLASTRFARNHDVILRYTKSDEWVWNAAYRPHDISYTDAFYRFEDADGRRYQLADLTNPNKDRANLTYEFRGVTRVWRWTRDRMAAADAAGLIVQSRAGSVPRLKRYLDEQEGNPLDDVWSDIAPVQANSTVDRRLGYPTQKPVALLERIIAASSDGDAVVLDPFCGCGTAIHAAQKMGRRWIGIDVTHLAISLIEKRLKDAFPDIAFTVEGTPRDLASALDLAARDKYQFQWWAVSLVDAQPYGGRRKGADGGIDGVIWLQLSATGKADRALVSVKAGANVNVAMIRDLKGTMEREKAPFGLFLTVTPPTRPMREEAASAGTWRDPLTDQAFSRLQIITLQELMDGKRPRLPIVNRAAAFRRAGREDTTRQERLL
ncbi:restriction endonuclease [Microvirga sp. SRT01]|uniref:site-specific DNA-methyltransferase (adenine-specific) n=1 Tax=Sphingomonas longa TaxID=2778730 RepID=A0ABS2D726_9SPHN|nr:MULTISPECIES: DNA methyltransferase [Alphaproteobacteria]MBM6576742.1 restriction endonuclease [Sphingomonas sp. BT552]MBR7709787.1 restriction endonuclease [Microvirga sp. SRT01]